MLLIQCLWSGEQGGGYSWCRPHWAARPQKTWGTFSVTHIFIALDDWTIILRDISKGQYTWSDSTSTISLCQRCIVQWQYSDLNLLYRSCDERCTEGAHERCIEGAFMFNRNINPIYLTDARIVISPFLGSFSTIFRFYTWRAHIKDLPLEGLIQITYQLNISSKSSHGNILRIVYVHYLVSSIVSPSNVVWSPSRASCTCTINSCCALRVGLWL